MHICTVNKEKDKSLYTGQNKYIKNKMMTVMWHKCDLLEYGNIGTIWSTVPTGEEAKENERSPTVASLHAGLLRRDMVYEQERVLRGCDGLFCSMSVTYDGAVPP